MEKTLHKVKIKILSKNHQSEPYNIWNFYIVNLTSFSIKTVLLTLIIKEVEV